jgi:hypothetical protein
MALSQSSYKLKRFLNSRDPDFAAALMIYVRNTPSEARTDTNEISYWLGEFSRKFGHDFYVFGFYRDRHLVGFAEAAYFNDSRLIMLDYIVLAENHRTNNVFYEFVDQLKNYLERAHPQYRYAVAEVCYGPSLEYPSSASSLLTRLLKLQGFRVIQARYYQPRLMIDYMESEMRADLLIYSATPIDQMRADTYLSIVRTIYYQYYLAWKAVAPETVDAYKRHLNDLYSKIESSLKRKTVVPVNGHQIVLAAPKKVTAMTIHRIVSFSAQALSVIVLLTTALLGLKVAFGLSSWSFTAIYALSLLSFLAVAGIVSKNARIMFSEVVAVAKFVFRKKSGNLMPNESVLEHASSDDPDAQE